MGWLRLLFGCSSSDLGLARGTCRAGGEFLPDTGRNVGIASRTCRAGSELGRSCALRFAAACACTSSGRAFLGRARCPRAVVGRAAGPDGPSSLPSRGGACTGLGIAANRRARQARRSAGDFVEPASSVMGPAEARDAAGASRSSHASSARLGLASGCSGAASNRGALMGRACPVRVGCPEDGGACSSRCTVMVCASGRSRRLSAAVERASSDCGMVGAGARCRASTQNRRHPGGRSRTDGAPVGGSGRRWVCLAGRASGRNHDSRQRRDDGLGISRESRVDHADAGLAASPRGSGRGRSRGDDGHRQQDPSTGRRITQRGS